MKKNGLKDNNTVFPSIVRTGFGTAASAAASAARRVAASATEDEEYLPPISKFTSVNKPRVSGGALSSRRSVA